MKNLILLLLPLWMIVFGCTADRSTVTTPEALVTKFKSLYPDAKDVTWEMEDSLYEASFRQDTVKKSVTLNPDGTVRFMETDISPDSLPQAVKDYVVQQAGGKKISGAAMITYADGHFAYEAEVEKLDYLFDGAGQYLSVETEEGEEEEEK